MGCDPEFRKELNKVNRELDIEFEIAMASEDMMIWELFDEAAKHGETYSQGYQDGFRAGRELLLELRSHIAEASHKKHDALSKRWGFDDLPT